MIALAGCASVGRLFDSPPAAEPAGREGWVAYRVAALRVEAPADWKASGGPRALTLDEPAGQGKLAVSVADDLHQDAKACLAAGEVSLQRGAAGLERVRRYPSKLAGAPAVAQEADRGAWHGWAWAVCDGGTLYRIFFTAPATAPAAVLEVHKALLAARLVPTVGTRRAPLGGEGAASSGKQGGAS